MEACEKDILAQDCLDDVYRRLSSLAHMIDTVCLGLKCEKTEQQVLDCVMCIGYVVKEIQDTAKKALLEIREEEPE